MATTIDTLQLAKEFRGVRFTDEQAEVLARALKASDDSALTNVVTKAELRYEIGKLGAGPRIEALWLRLQRAEYKAELRRDFASLRAEIVRSKNEVLMWLVPMLIGQACLTVTLLKMLGP